jgi:hypothetical protein
MIKSSLLAAIGAALALTLIASAGTAAPLSQAAEGTLSAAATLDLVEQTHGCHRTCLLGRVPRWGGAIRLHRHVEPACVPVRC